MEESRDTIDNIKNAETAINQDPLPRSRSVSSTSWSGRRDSWPNFPAGWDVPLPAASTPLGAR